MDIISVLNYVEAKIKYIVMLETHNGINLLRRYIWLTLTDSILLLHFEAEARESYFLNDKTIFSIPI